MGPRALTEAGSSHLWAGLEKSVEVHGLVLLCQGLFSSPIAILGLAGIIRLCRRPSPVNDITGPNYYANGNYLLL